MALPTSSIWNLADFSGTAFSNLLTLGPSDLTAVPSVSPYFTYNDDLTIINAKSDNGVPASLSFSTSVPNRFTLDVVLRCPSLPHNTGDLSKRAVGFTVADDAGRGFTMYLAKTGVSISRVDDLGSVTALPDTTDVTEAVATDVHTIRVAIDSASGRAYVFYGSGFTETPALKWIIPVEATPPNVTDLFQFFVKGIPSEPVTVELHQLRLAGDLVISNYPPVASAGPDRVAPVGSAVRLDGRESYDVEGAQLTYAWSCIDAPLTSTYAGELSAISTQDDGDSDGSTPFIQCDPLDMPDWISPGDIFRIQGGLYVVESVNFGTGVVTTTEDDVPDDLGGTPARVIRQSILLDTTSSTPTAVPDISGLYRFRLAVNDGEIDSESSEVLANITALQTPFGIEPGVEILWKAIGDEWKLFEGRDVFEEAWRGVSQILAGKLLEVWQHHYNTSIRDAQRVFQRKWAAYKTLEPETSPDTATISYRHGILASPFAFEEGDADATGQSLTFYFLEKNDPAEHSITVELSAGDLPTIVSDINNGLLSVGYESIWAAAGGCREASFDLRADTTGQTAGTVGGFVTTVTFPASTLPSWVSSGDIVCFAGGRYTVDTVDLSGTLTLNEEAPALLSGTLRVYRAARLYLFGVGYFRVGGAAATTLGLPTDQNYLAGITGAPVTDRVYYVEGVDLVAQGVTRNDLLVLNNGESFQIDRVINDPSDPGPNQRVLLFDTLPLDATATWSIPSVVLSTEVDYERAGAYPGDLVKTEIYYADTGATTVTNSTVVAQKGMQLAVNLGLEVHSAELTDAETRFIGLKRRKAIPVSSDVVSVPALQELIATKLNPTRLRENIDYVLEPFYRDIDGAALPMLQFQDATWLTPDLEPPDVLWAEVTLFDNEGHVEDLFGRLVGFLRDDAASFPPDFNYTAGVAGLLYAQQRGPSLFAMGVGAQILLGQPFAEVAGYIEEIRTDYSPRQGRVLIRDDDGNVPTGSETVRAYYYKKDPNDLSTTSGLALNDLTSAPWATGDAIPQFSAIGAGIDIVDMYEDPKWWLSFVRSGVMSEVEKFHTHMVEFNTDLVSLANIALLYSLMMRIKPTYTKTFLVGSKFIDDELDLDDTVGAEVTLNLLDSLNGAYGYHYDDYRGDGTTSANYDDGATKYDGLIDTIIDGVVFCCILDWPGGPLTFDLPLFYDTPVVDVDGAHTGTMGQTFLPTYDMDLEEGTYETCATLKPLTGVLP